MVILENETCKASIHPMGGELTSLYNKATGLEYIWDGNPDYWPRHSPVLFPIVGGLKEDAFIYKGQKYELIKHGFARDTEFEVESSSATEATFVLKSNDETLKVYPFHFELRHHYKLDANSISLHYEVKNPTVTPMFFSIGAHPAFNVPLVEGTTYEDYYLQFSEEERSSRWEVDGNLLTQPVPYLNGDRIALKHDLFYQDALIFKDLRSGSISILSDKTSHGVKYTFQGFPYMGIWAATDAPFVCIEPWHGIPDSVNHDQELEKKEGIIELPPLQTWTDNWKVEAF